jgi:hypothetical protein
VDGNDFQRPLPQVAHHAEHTLVAFRYSCQPVFHARIIWINFFALRIRNHFF